jgi:translation initiation factor 1
VTVISELQLSESALKELATALKGRCGSGGTAKDGRIEIQGDHRDTIAEELTRRGYKVKRSGG